MTTVDAGELLGELFAGRHVVDPYPVYRRLVACGPAMRSGRHEIVVVGYQASRQVLLDDSFTTQGASWRDGHQPGWREHPAYVDASAFLLLRDPPEHTRLRSALVRALPVGRVASRCARWSPNSCARSWPSWLSSWTGRRSPISWPRWPRRCRNGSSERCWVSRWPIIRCCWDG